MRNRPAGGAALVLSLGCALLGGPIAAQPLAPPAAPASATQSAPQSTQPSTAPSTPQSPPQSAPQSTQPSTAPSTPQSAPQSTQPSTQPSTAPSTPQSPPQSAPQSAPQPVPAQGWFGKPDPLIVPVFVDEFPGVDLSHLSPAARERFLQRANTEMCTCGQSGCHRHTLAYCLKVDVKCPRARRMLQQIAEELAPPPAVASPPTAPLPTPAR